MTKNTLKKRLAGLGAATVVAVAGVFGANQIHKNNQEKEALQAQRETLIQQIHSNPSLQDVDSYVYSDELKALQILINRQLPTDKQMKVDGYLPNSEISHHSGGTTRPLAEFEWALEGMSHTDLKTLNTNLSEKIDMTILDCWSNGDISPKARSTFNRMVQRRANQSANDGSATKEVQRALNAMGAKLAIDGNFGPQSKKALDAVFSSKEKLQAFVKCYKAERIKAQNNALIKAAQQSQIR